MGHTSTLSQISDGHKNCSLITWAPQISMGIWGSGEPFLNYLLKFYLNTEINGKFRGNGDVGGVVVVVCSSLEVR